MVDPGTAGGRDWARVSARRNRLLASGLSAGADDIWLLSATAVKLLERFLNEKSALSFFEVYEQVQEHGTFAGVAPATFNTRS